MVFTLVRMRQNAQGSALEQELAYDREALKEQVTREIGTLNVEQRLAFNHVLDLSSMTRENSSASMLQVGRAKPISLTFAYLL